MAALSEELEHRITISGLTLRYSILCGLADADTMDIGGQIDILSRANRQLGIGFRITIVIDANVNQRDDTPQFHIMNPPAINNKLGFQKKPQPSFSQ